ncbi:MAG: glycosyltransferase, partial [Xanthobacteraceae bacterium]|nr:glycosyltransferase [Xanthobacteraceae bacterium]
DMPLRIAAKVDAQDREYYNARVKPLLDGSHIEYVGEISDREKSAFLSSAIALLNPIDWPEPFGLVMIEAMACAVPVIAFNRGSVPEIVEDGVTGLIVEDEKGAIGALDRVAKLQRERIRARFEERFTARRMAQDYLAVYRSLAERDQRHLRLVADRTS